MSKEGWTKPGTSRKWHYFVDYRSLCRKWGILDDSDLEQGNDESPDNCSVCRRILKKRKVEDEPDVRSDV